MGETDLVVEFDRDDPEFSLGVEIGMLWQRLTLEPLPVVALIRSGNAEMALRLAEAVSATVRAEELGDDWLELTYA